MVTVIGAGIAGAACAAALKQRGIEVRVVDRGRAPGGRMASPELHGRRVDIGAAYFTATEADFVAQVQSWEKAGLARPWTDTFGVYEAGEWRTTTGPMRWATPQGLRSLVREILDGIEVEVGEVTELPEGDVVLAMPDPQAARILPLDDAVAFDPVQAIVCGYAERTWDFEHATFVNGHEITFIADDGDRRGDDAPVLVVHTTGHAEALTDLLGTPEPLWTYSHRWGFAKPAAQHDAPFRIEGRVGFCGDQYCPDGAPRVESAWLSGTRLAAALPVGR